MGANVFHCGEVGSGMTIALVNHLITGALILASSEGMALGKKLGLEPHLMASAFTKSSSRNWFIESFNPLLGPNYELPGG